jgi:hypothetical protein
MRCFTTNCSSIATNPRRLSESQIDLFDHLAMRIEVLLLGNAKKLTPSPAARLCDKV